MSHAIEFFDFEENTSRGKICDVCSKWYYNNCDLEETGGSNPFFGVDFINKTFDCYEDAENYLLEINEGGDCTCVEYKHTPNWKPSTKLKNLSSRLKTLNKRVNELTTSWKPNEMKSNTISCKCCGSKLATAYMEGKHNCPLCKNDLRPKTLKERIEKAEKEFKKINAEVNKLTVEEMKKHNSKNFETRYLVLCDVHC